MKYTKFNKPKGTTNITFEIDLSNESKIWDNSTNVPSTLDTSIDCKNIVKESKIISKGASHILKVTLMKGLLTDIYYAKLSFDITKTHGSDPERKHRYSINLKMDYAVDPSDDIGINVGYVVNSTAEDYLESLETKNNGDTLVTKKGLVLNLKEFARQLKLTRTICIRYDLNGGDWKDGNQGKTSAPEGHSYTAPSPIRMGYIFKGWKSFSIDKEPSPEERTDLTKGVSETTIQLNSTGSQLALAMWEPINYQITYNWENRDATLREAINPNSFTYGKNDANPIELPSGNPLSKEGYEDAKSWAITGINGEIYRNIKSITPNQLYNLTQPVDATGEGITKIDIVREIKAKTYTIEYTGINDATMDNNSDDHIFHYGDTLTLPIPIKDGYKFDGWEVKGSNGSANNFTLTNSDISDNTLSGSTITLEAHFTDIAKIKYRVILDPAGGIIPNSENGSLVFASNDLNVTLPTVTRLGYEFNGWKLNDSTDGDITSSGNTYTFTSNLTPDHDVLIEATWIAKKVNVFYTTYTRKNKTIGYTRPNNNIASTLVEVGSELSIQKLEKDYFLYKGTEKLKQLTTNVGLNWTLDNAADLLGMNNNKTFIVDGNDITFNFFFTEEDYQKTSFIKYTVTHKIAGGSNLFVETKKVNKNSEFVSVEPSELLLTNGFTLANEGNDIGVKAVDNNKQFDITYNPGNTKVNIIGNGFTSNKSYDYCKKGSLVFINSSNSGLQVTIDKSVQNLSYNYSELYLDGFNIKITGFFVEGPNSKYSADYNEILLESQYTTITVFGDIDIEVIPKSIPTITVVYHHPDVPGNLTEKPANSGWVTTTRSYPFEPGKDIVLEEVPVAGFAFQGWVANNNCDSNSIVDNLYDSAFNKIHSISIKPSSSTQEYHVYGRYEYMGNINISKLDGALVIGKYMPNMQEQYYCVNLNKSIKDNLINSLAYGNIGDPYQYILKGNSGDRLNSAVYKGTKLYFSPIIYIADYPNRTAYAKYGKSYVFKLDWKGESTSGSNIIFDKCIPAPV